MGIWRGLRVAFILGSLFMILLIIIYWDDVGGFNLYPLQNPKHESLPSDLATDLSLSPSTSEAQITSSTTTSTITPSKNLIPEKPREAAEEEVREDKEGQRREEMRQDDERERSKTYFDNKEQEARKQTIMDVCLGKDAVEFPGRTRAFEQVPNRELDHLIVDDKHQIIYCYVPKVACTNWKRIMVVLSQSLISPSTGKPYTDPEAVPPDLVHNSSLHLTFAKFWRNYGSLSRHLMALKLQHYTKFLFVRDPFVRLISAFRNKFGRPFEGQLPCKMMGFMCAIKLRITQAKTLPGAVWGCFSCSRTRSYEWNCSPYRPNENFYREFGSVMLRRYGNASGSLPETAAEAFAAGIKPTFEQFLSYLLDPETERKRVFNEHWRQVYRLCHPCQVKYDFIGRLETLETDAELLLKLLQVDHLVRFPSGSQNHTATSWERDWFAQIPLTMRRELYKLYEPDFKLFGYPKPDSVLH